MADIKFEITNHLGVLSQGSKGWQKEVNMVSWNERPPKFDIRDWGPGNERMGKGVTLSKEELQALKQLLQEINLDGL
ncbi:YdbC family protein [Syntrophomonas palmitatica]|uniref:YdbC family protein n=1 Tax=Syntrophomonas palmitatica TaxID=402877 RepID=UPI0006D06F2E|nr:PC4/YdbC family ssDNA-binding protein [Syntrophomonas palmitatica]